MLLAAGDIASCVSTGDEATAAILDAAPGLVATLGDNAYPNGSSADFAQCYHPSWGRHLARTRPSIGNHEYHTPGGAGYWGYFGPLAGPFRKTWYSYDLGAWHVVALDSNCHVIDCGPGSEQERWLRADLAATPADCTVAYFHHARFSSGAVSQIEDFRPIWDALYQHGVDLVLTGHYHIYERHAPQTPTGDRRADYGLRQFIVGTGGHSHGSLIARHASSEIANADTYGVLKVTLRPGAYDWVFLPEAGRTFTDNGSDACHGAPPDRVPPSARLLEPADGSLLWGTRTLAASASDDAALARVDFVVDQTVVASIDEPPYRVEWDTNAIADGRRRLIARGVDAAGNAGDSASTTVVVDNVLPETSITRSPPPDSRVRTATFLFGSEPGATFECALDGALLGVCENPLRLEGLEPGRHTILVQARDAVGKVDPTPARFSWRIDLRPPQTRIDYSTTARGAGGGATFRFASSEARSTFRCSLDGGAWQPCASRFRAAGVAAGRHSFRVRAIDAAGNVDWSPAARGWVVAPRASGAVITGSATRDVLLGTRGDDVIDAGGGADEIRGRGGRDAIAGGRGADRIDGGAGDDTLTGGPGRDTLLGGRGRDALETRDREPDEARGGPGRDIAYADRRLDVLRGIERRRF